MVGGSSGVGIGGVENNIRIRYKTFIEQSGKETTQMKSLFCPLIRDGIMSSTFWYKFEKSYGYEESQSVETEIAEEDENE